MQKHKIPINKVIPNYELSLQQKLQTKYDFPPANRTYCNGYKSIEIAILKYYPKYCYSLHLDQGYGRNKVFSRVKQIKTLDHFAWNFGEDIQPLNEEITKKVKNLLKNKRKSIKSLPHTGFRYYEKKYFMEMCPFFPRIQTLEVALPRGHFPVINNHFVPRDVEKEIEKAYGYFWKTLKHVKSVKMSTATPYFWLILQKINSSKEFLSRLKDFSLTIKYFNEVVQKYSPIALFQILMQNQELLQRITHINFGHFESFHYFGDQIKAILNNCPKLVSLVFPIEKEFYSSHKKLPGPKHYLTLAPLQSLQNVRILTLNGYDVWSLIQVFEFPLLLEKLTLHLYYTSSWLPLWSDLYEESADSLPLKIKDEEKYRTLLSFFERFKSLAHLADLSLNMPRFTETNHIMQNFILPLIKAIPNLKNLECQLYQGYLERNHHFDLSTFLDDLQLESVKIFQQMRSKKFYFATEDLVMTYNPSESFSFPNLKSLDIDTWISQDFDFKNFFKKCATQAVREINLPRIYMNSLEALQKLLNSFEDLELSSLKISLGVTLCVKSLTQMTQYFSSSPIILPNNVSTTLNVHFPSSFKEFILSKKGIETMLNIFGKFRLNISLLCKKNFEQHDQSIRSKPLMKNNKRDATHYSHYYCIDQDDEHFKKSIQEDDSNSDIENGFLVDPEIYYEEEKKRKIQESYDDDDDEEDAQSEENDEKGEDEDSNNSSGNGGEERRMKELEEKKKEKKKKKKKKKANQKKVVLPVKVSQNSKGKRQKKDHGWKNYKLLVFLLVLLLLIIPLFIQYFSTQ